MLYSNVAARTVTRSADITTDSSAAIRRYLYQGSLWPALYNRITHAASSPQSILVVATPYTDLLIDYMLTSVGVCMVFVYSVCVLRRGLATHC